MRRLLLALALVLVGGAGQAQDAPDAPTTLVADSVTIDAEGQLIAQGNVEVLQGDTRLTATRIVYREDTGGLSIEGPITITQGTQAVLVASTAEISQDLRDGILRSARLVLDERLQLAATEINRVDGRYTQLSRVVSSSCEVCAARPVPLWQIRARRVIHDQLEQQLYFDDARFEVYGVPVFYLPRLRLPDPALERATGFLVPEFTQSNRLGFGAKIPYFVALTPSADVTIAPWITAKSLTLEGRYRQAFRTGNVVLDGAVTWDDLLPGQARGYLFGVGSFALPRDYQLNFDIEAASDGDYLDDYDYSGKDRLDSAISIARADNDELLGAEAIYYYIPGADRDDDTQTSLLGDLLYINRFTPGALGGTGTIRLAAHGHERPSDADIEGRDVGRIEGQLGWRRDAVGPAGLLFAAEAQVLAQWDRITDDTRFIDADFRVLPTAAVELRWPLARQGRGAGGATHLIEPVAQLVWTSDQAITDRPADESTQIELDEGNLFSFSRFAAGDRIEAGLRANLGLSYTRYDPAGWSMGVTVGRVVRAEDLGQFDGYAAFDGGQSDWLLSLGVDVQNQLTLSGRALFDNDLQADRIETRLGWRSDRLALAGSYAWLSASEIEDRPDPTNQWRIDGRYRVNERLRASADLAYDLQRERAADTTIGIEYRTECVTFDFGVRQRYTEDLQGTPDTSFTFQVALAGFGDAGAGPRPARRGCAR